MSGDIWKFSDQIDDVDAEMLRRDFITLREGMEYYERASHDLHMTRNTLYTCRRMQSARSRSQGRAAAM